MPPFGRAAGPQPTVVPAILTLLPISSYSCLMSAARAVGGRMKRLRPGLIASESRHGGAAAVRVVGHQPTSSRLAGVTPASTDAPVAEITAAGLPLLAAPVAGSDVTTGDTTGDTT